MTRRDEFDDPEGFFSRLMTDTGRQAGSLFENRSLWVSGAIFVVVVALSGVIWASYPSQNTLMTEGAVPIIRADAEPYKHVPEERGGMMIAHQDSTVFEAMRGGSARVENLLSDADEKPIDRTQLFAGLKTDLTDEKAKGQEVARMDDYVQERPMTESERRREAARRNREQLKEEAPPLPGAVKTSSGSVPDVLNGHEIKPNADEAGDATDDQVAPPPSDQDLQAVPPGKNTVAGKGQKEPKESKGLKSADELSKPAPLKQDLASQSHKEQMPKNEAKPQVKEDLTLAKKAKKEPAPTPEKMQKKKPDPKEEGIAATPAPALTDAQNGGTAYVQVASTSSAAAAAGEWSKLSAKLPMLAGKPYRVQSGNAHGRTVHRVQIGPMSKEAAKSLCDAIKAKKPGGCLVVK